MGEGFAVIQLTNDQLTSFRTATPTMTQLRLRALHLHDRESGTGVDTSPPVPAWHQLGKKQGCSAWAPRTEGEGTVV